MPLIAPTRGLPASDHWLISICRALVRKARLIVMDEPTASLSEVETERLFTIIEDLSRSGVAVLYVSHRLDEIMRLCRRVTVFRDGRQAAALQPGEVTRDSLVQNIVGGAIAAPAVHRAEETVTGEPVLRISGLARAPMVRGVDLTLHRGEVLGIGGLVGAGRSELARLIFGADRPDSGRMELEGADFAPRSPAAAVRAGLGYVPEERRAEGLLLTRSIGFNLSLANLGKLNAMPALPLISGRKRECAGAGNHPGAVDQDRRARQFRWAGCRAAISRRSSSAAGLPADPAC